MSDTVPDLLAALIRSVDAARAERKRSPFECGDCGLERAAADTSRTHRRTNHQGGPMSETPTVENDALAKALYQMNGHAWYGRDLGDWDDPESRIGRNSAERDRWYRQADALLVVGGRDR